MNGDVQDYMGESGNQGEGMVAVMQGAQGNQIKAAVILAKQFPRSETRVMTALIAACQRRRFAEEAMYAYPKGKKKIIDESKKETWVDNIVTGPSIRMAEEVARIWGNINYGQININANDREGYSEVMAFGWDLESNTFQSRIFRVRHEIKSGNSLKKLTDPRDIYELEANMGARRMRACIMSLIPKDILDELMEICEKTLENDTSAPLEERIKKMALAFSRDFSVSLEMLEKRLGKTIDEFAGPDVVQMQKVYKSLRDGFASAADFFEDLRVKPVNENTKELTNKYAQKGNEETATNATQDAAETGQTSQENPDEAKEGEESAQ